MGFAVVGCSLDALDAEEKVAMKLAYLYARREGVIGEDVARDPYDLMERRLAELPGVSVAGRLEIESWLTPRPALRDLDSVDPRLYREFLDTGGCEVMSARLREFVKERVLPLRPLFVGVDHSLTGGVLEALASECARPALVVLDSHFDAVPASVRKAAADSSAGNGEAELEPPESYNCGTWLARVMDKGLVASEQLVVIGPSDHPGYDIVEGETESMAVYRESYLSYESRGVRVIPKRKLRDEGIRKAILEALAGLEGKPVYVSVDSDIGAGEQVKAVRFLDTIGLSFHEVSEVAGALWGWLRATGSELVGLDLMEIDVHLADIPGSDDRTVEMCETLAGQIISC